MKHIISTKVLETVIKAEKKNSGATFTIKSLKTSKDYTYSINRKKYNDKWFTFVNVETTYLKFDKLGSYFNGKIYNAGKVVDSPSALAIAWVLKKVEEGQFEMLDKNVELMHTGSCLRCGRILTDAISIERGLGPTCMHL